MPKYLALTFDVPAELCELAASLLHDADAQGVEIRDREVLPPPGMTPVPEGRAVAIGYFGDEVEGDPILAEVRAELEAQAEGQEIRAGLERLDDQNWSETWKLHFQPLHVGGRLWVLPPWERAPEGQIAVVIEPGMAFGTGGHATTALCLEGTLEALERRPSASAADIGCGSGILGIAAAKLGAKRVVMIDNDPVAVAVAKENAVANGCPSIATSDRPVESLGERFDLVLANILAGTLVELAEPIAACVAEGGDLLLSGILVSQAADVRAAYENQGLRAREQRISGEWALVWMERVAA
ncbi:50S ribosomal protein L11 methyltransferase [Vulgatibacter incomptus]|uniref:Ribosomal protein L11 methyltransferase n=1 Tax=Vulgatibacter incomptus TaxID=1391653 RepID=A0A0K1PF35_9BACT|nr:50S ribosomal protein L11 methyltransferase [Vulgatibacter incomptus]AKU92135.1 Ribosomal protein L11 methyltransferase [Vulgatibacter incomptus]